MKTTELLNERAKTHGDFHQGAELFNTLSLEIAAAEGLDSSHRYALNMIATKIVRIIHGNANEPDHWRDIIGYATLGGRLNQSTPQAPSK